MRSKPDPVDQPERTAHYDCATRDDDWMIIDEDDEDDD